MPLPDRIPPTTNLLVRESHVALAPRGAAAPRPDTLAETLRKIWRHRKVVFLCTIGAIVAATIVAFALPTHYLAEAQVLVTPPEGSQLFTDLNPPSGAASGMNSDDRVQSERYVALSRPVAQSVVSQLNLVQDREFNSALPQPGISFPNPFIYVANAVRALFAPGGPGSQPSAQNKSDRVVDKLMSNVDVSVLGRSDVLDIAVKSIDPTKAAHIANAVANDYLTLQRSNKMDDSSQIESYMDNRIAKLRQQVQDADQAVETYRSQNGLYVGETSELTSQQVTEINTQLTDAETAKAEADANLQEALSVQKQGLDSDSVPAVIASPLIQTLKEQQSQAEQNLAQLSASYGDKHPKVVEARAQIRNIRRKIQDEIGSIVAGLEHQDRVAAAHAAALDRSFQSTQKRLGGVGNRQIQLDSLERDATVYRNLLESMLTRQKEISWQKALEQSDARIISPASPPDRPSFPPKTLIVLLGAVIGGLAGMMAALMRDNADPTFRRYDELEAATGIPVIALVPNQRTASPAAQVLQRPYSPYCEALRRIHVGIQMLDMERPQKTILFCSATPGEGKSVMLASLGRVLATQGKRVLLIDCDWRAPNLHRLFRIQNRSGLASLLTDTSLVVEDCVHRDALSGLDVIPSGHWDSKDVTALASERMKQLLDAVGKVYDVVLLDAAPVLVGAEVLLLSRIVDKVLFTVRWGHTHRAAVYEALRQLIDARGDLAGLVLSRVDPKRYRQYATSPLNYSYMRPAA